MPLLPNCGDCKHFCEHNDSEPKHIGWCDVRLPNWLLRTIPDLEEVSRTVRRDDSCSLFVDNP